MSSKRGCERQGLEHTWFGSLSSVVATHQVVIQDWCIRCGEWADAKPHIVHKGQRREVEDVEPPEGLL